MSVDLHEVMTALAKVRPIFHSEADFQHALAWSIQTTQPKASIRLEIPLKLPAGELDLLVGLNGERIGIELKYVRANLSCDIRGERFTLLKSPLPPGRYGFWSDLSRLEEWTASRQLTRGVAIVLSNCGNCWTQPDRTTTQDAICFHQGRVVSGSLSLKERPLSNKEIAPVTLNGSYICDWRDFSTVESTPTSRFRYLLLEAAVVC